MTDVLRIIIALSSILFFVFVLTRVRREKLLLPYSFFWLIIAILGLVAIAFPTAVMSISYFIGFETASNFVFFIVIVFALLFLFYLSSVISQLTIKIKNATQEIAILKAQCQKIEKNNNCHSGEE